MAMVNIPSTCSDPQYRYKMPRLVSKKESRGNGRKTCIVNMSDVAHSLKRPPLYTIKWFSIELCTVVSYTCKPGEGERAIVNGHYDTHVFQNLLDRFIDKYVLCVKCHLPEIDMLIKRGSIRAKCKACGWGGELDNVHKLAAFIIKNPPDETGVSIVNAGESGGPKLDRKERQERRRMNKDNEEKEDEEGKAKEGKAEKEETDKKEEKGDKEDKGRTEKVEMRQKREKKDQMKKKNTKEKMSKHKDKGNEEELEEAVGDEEGKEPKKKEVKDRKETQKKEKKEEKAKKEAPQETTEERETQMKQDTGSAKEGGSEGPGLRALRPSRGKSSHELEYHEEETKNVIGALRSFSGSKARLEVDTFIEEARMQQQAKNFDSRTKLYIVLEALCGSGMDAQVLTSKKKYVDACISSAHLGAVDVLWALGAYTELNPSAIKCFAKILKVCYDEDWTEEAEILRYYDDDKGMGNPAFSETKQAAAPLLEWLKTAEAEDDEDEQDEQDEQDEDKNEEVDDNDDDDH